MLSASDRLTILGVELSQSVIELTNWLFGKCRCFSPYSELSWPKLWRKNILELLQMPGKYSVLQLVVTELLFSSAFFPHYLKKNIVYQLLREIIQEVIFS